MPPLITEKSIVKCAHNGVVTLKASQTLLTIDGTAVLVEEDLDGATITGCTTVTNAVSGTKQCLTVVAMSAGAATTLSVGGKAVLLASATGTTDGVTAVPSNFWSVQSAGQTAISAD
jgi:hypothetical protein